MNLDDTKKRVQKYLNSNKRYPLIVDVQTKETSLDKGTQRKTTENELPSLTQCTA